MIGAPQYYAINRLGIGLATLIFYCGYLLSMFILGWLLNGERYDREKFIATLLALLGLCLTYAPSLRGTTLLPFVGALLAGLSIGIDMVVSQRITYGTSQTTVLAWATGIIGSIPTAFILHEHVPPLIDVHWLYLLAFVGVCIAASWLSIHGVKRIEAGAAGILGLLEVVWALLFGIAFFHERPHAIVYVGAVCIIAAAVIPYSKTAQTTANKEIIEEMPI
jgi:S-adenosylmethionine uptake transporter